MIGDIVGKSEYDIFEKFIETIQNSKEYHTVEEHIREFIASKPPNITKLDKIRGVLLEKNLRGRS